MGLGPRDKPRAGLGPRFCTPHSLGLEEDEEVRGGLGSGRGDEHRDLDRSQPLGLPEERLDRTDRGGANARRSVLSCLKPCWETGCVLISRKFWSLSVEKQRSSCGPECRVSGGPFLRGSSLKDLCFLVDSCVTELFVVPSLKGLCTEFQCTSSFFG